MTPEQRALAEYMGDMSDKYLFAGWHYDTERWLWSVLQGELVHPRETPTPEEVEHLRVLKDAAGCWIHWVDGGGGETPISLEEWERMVGRA